MGAGASFRDSASIANALVDVNSDFEKYREVIASADLSHETLNNLESFDDAKQLVYSILSDVQERDLDAIANLLFTFSHSFHDNLSPINSALIFIKPHANNEKVQALVTQTLTKNNLSIVSEGEITGEEIDSKMLIDHHYGSIAEKATLKKPLEMNVPKDKFNEFFGADFDQCVGNGKVMNALDAAAFLELDAFALESHWRNAKTIKFGGGFYCAYIDSVEDKDPIYVFNAFFMAMRADFVVPGSSIHYYVVEWNPVSTGITWKSFRADILGATDPTTSFQGSLRGLIMENWEGLGLSAPPTTGKNGVHGSASPIEGLSEKNNWLNTDFNDDAFGKSLISSLNISIEDVKQFCNDKKIQGIGSVFDYFEDTDVNDCYRKAVILKYK